MDSLNSYCRWYLFGRCKFGNKCRYQHRPLPFNLCKYFFMTSKCRLSHTCPFSHNYPVSAAGQLESRSVQSPAAEEVKKEPPVTAVSKPKAESKPIIVEKVETRTAFMKQGLKADEKATFEANKKEWERFSNYLDYLKSLKDSQEQDIAQVLRRYQYSFARRPSAGEGVTSISVKHT